MSSATKADEWNCTPHWCNHLDIQIGRIVETLRDNNQLDNTLIVFLSDNGADGVDFYDIPVNGRWVRSQYDNAYENMGSPTSFVCYGEGWGASVDVAPGGVLRTTPWKEAFRPPFVIAGPGIEASPEVHQEAFSIQDLSATFLELAGVQYPTTHNGRPVVPIRGQSAWPLWQGKSIQQDTARIFATEMAEMAYVQQGPWKINSVRQADQNIFSLYNLEADSGEQHDVSEQYPDQKTALMRAWEGFKQEVGVIFLKREE